MTSPLYLANKYFALASQRDLSFFAQIQEAITFVNAHVPDKKCTLSKPTLLSLIFHKILKLYQNDRQPIGFYHWDMFPQDKAPLWLYAQFSKILKTLAPYPTSLIIVTNIKASLFTSKKNHREQEIRLYLQELAALECASNPNIHLIFL